MQRCRWRIFGWLQLLLFRDSFCLCEITVPTETTPGVHADILIFFFLRAIAVLLRQLLLLLDSFPREIALGFIQILRPASSFLQSSCMQLRNSFFCMWSPFSRISCSFCIWEMLLHACKLCCPEVGTASLRCLSLLSLCLLQHVLQTWRERIACASYVYWRQCFSGSLSCQNLHGRSWASLAARSNGKRARRNPCGDFGRSLSNSFESALICCCSSESLLGRNKRAMALVINVVMRLVYQSEIINKSERVYEFEVRLIIGGQSSRLKQYTSLTSVQQSDVSLWVWNSPLVWA